MLPNALFGTVHMYGIMIAVGILACFAVLYLYGKRMAIPEKFLDFVFYNGVGAIIVGFGAAALFQALYDYIEDPSKGFRISGSITFLGGLIGGTAFFLVVYFLLRRRLCARLIDVLSIVPCMITVAHAFGRLGCFFAGCCYGRPTDSFLGVCFASGSAAASRYPDYTQSPVTSVPLLPTQLFEAAFLFLLFGLCSYLLLRRGFQHNMSLYLFSYGVFRFINEFFRADHRGEFLGSLSPSQFWSLLMAVGGIVMFFVSRHLFRQGKLCPADWRAKQAEDVPAEEGQTPPAA